MFIKYNGTNVHALGSTNGQTILYLKPGWQEFPKAMFGQYISHPEIVQMLKDKKIELMSEAVSETKGNKKVARIIGANDDPINLTELPQQKALEIINETYDKALLQRWSDEDTRHKVKRALDAQLQLMDPKNNKVG